MDKFLSRRHHRSSISSEEKESSYQFVAMCILIDSPNTKCLILQA